MTCITAGGRLEYRLSRKRMVHGRRELLDAMWRRYRELLVAVALSAPVCATVLPQRACVAAALCAQASWIRERVDKLLSVARSVAA
eukprot:6018274-Pleurochrysis_carterae.AAC.1